VDVGVIADVRDERTWRRDRIMAIRDFEKRQLAEIEQHLADESPELAQKLAALGTAEAGTRHSIRSIVVMIATYVAGLTLIVAGVQVSSVPVIVLGALLTAAVPVTTGWHIWRTRT
jgi:hypothetical protein